MKFHAPADTPGETIVQIPARSNSSRVKDKNISDLGGLPLMAYTIRLAKQLKGVDRVLINTDSREYADIARQYGAELFELRPPEYATVTSSLGDAHEFIKTSITARNIRLRALITMLPTNPFRSLKRTQEMVDALNFYFYVGAAFRVNTPWQRLYCAENDMQPIYPNFRHAMPDRYTYFKLTGHFSAQNFGYLQYAPITKISGKFYKKVFFITDPIELIDIDDPADLDAARQTVDNGLYAFDWNPWHKSF